MSLDAVAFVGETATVSAHFTRVVLEVPDIERLTLPRHGDAAVGVYFGDSLSAPGRTYTVRDDDRANGRLVVDILMHGDGVGTAWARRARRGDKVILAHANSWYHPPMTTRWQLLVADMAGLPALARILDDPPAVPTTVVLDVDDDHLGYLSSRRGVTSARTLGVPLPQLVAAHTGTAGPGYCWFAGEAGEARAVRKHLRRELRWSHDQLDVMGYWRQDSTAWDRRFARVGADVFSAYTRALDAGQSRKRAFEEFDEALERAGL